MQDDQGKRPSLTWLAVICGLLMVPPVVFCFIVPEASTVFRWYEWGGLLVTLLIGLLARTPRATVRWWCWWVVLALNILLIVALPE